MDTTDDVYIHAIKRLVDENIIISINKFKLVNLENSGAISLL